MDVKIVCCGYITPARGDTSTVIFNSKLDLSDRRNPTTYSDYITEVISRFPSVRSVIPFSSSREQKIYEFINSKWVNVYRMSSNSPMLNTYEACSGKRSDITFDLRWIEKEEEV